MIQTSLLAQGTVAAVASTHRSASTSYPGVPPQPFQQPARNFVLGQGTPKRSFFWGKKHEFVPVGPHLPTSHAAQQEEPPGRATTVRFPLSARGIRWFCREGTGRWGQETPTQTPKAGREAAAGDQGQKKPQAALNPKAAGEQNTQFPTSPPSQGSILGTVPHVLLEPYVLHQGPAGRSCHISFFMKRLRKKHHLPLPSPRRKDAFNASLGLAQRGSVQGFGEDGERLRSLSKAFFIAKPRAGAVSLRDKSGPKQGLAYPRRGRGGGRSPEWGETPGSPPAPAGRFSSRLGKAGAKRHTSRCCLAPLRFSIFSPSLGLPANEKEEKNPFVRQGKAWGEGRGKGKKKGKKKRQKKKRQHVGGLLRRLLTLFFWLFYFLAERAPGAARQRVRPDHRTILGPPRGQSSAGSGRSLPAPRGLASKHRGVKRN